MRYAALVSFSDSSDFGPHRMLTDEQRHVAFRAPDEVLYALGDVHLLAGAARESEQEQSRRRGRAREYSNAKGCAGVTRPRSTRTTG